DQHGHRLRSAVSRRSGSWSPPWMSWSPPPATTRGRKRRSVRRRERSTAVRSRTNTEWRPPTPPPDGRSRARTVASSLPRRCCADQAGPPVRRCLVRRLLLASSHLYESNGWLVSLRSVVIGGPADGPPGRRRRRTLAEGA